MEFRTEQALQILERTPHVVETMLFGLDEEWIRSNEGPPETWSPYDVVGHYIHGEKTDWIPRMNIILGEGSKQFEVFDRLAQFRDSKGKTLNQLLDEFKVLRKANLEKLQAAELTDDNLDKTGIHPAFGNVTLRQLLAAWVVHDLTHIHQLSRVLAKQYEEEVGPWTVYMGVLNKY
jgi:DinB superfamily